MTVLKMYKTHKDVKLPEHQTQQSACFDLAFQMAGKQTITGYSSMNKKVGRPASKNLTISPGDRILVPTGLIMDIPEGYSVRIHARSGMALKQGLVMANAEGVIDSDYIEEVFVMVHNISQNAITITDGDRIAQGELVKNVEYTIEQTPARPLHKGRSGGFGSTGVQTIAKVAHVSDTVVINIPENNLPYKPDSFAVEKIQEAIKMDPEKAHALAKRTGKGKKWYNNGKEDKRFNEDEVPEGFVLGRRKGIPNSTSP